MAWTSPGVVHAGSAALAGIKPHGRYAFNGKGIAELTVIQLSGGKFQIGNI
jgi:hypothetical protein